MSKLASLLLTAGAMLIGFSGPSAAFSISAPASAGRGETLKSSVVSVDWVYERRSYAPVQPTVRPSAAVHATPRVIRPTVYLRPRYVRPTVQLSPRYVRPTVYLRPHYVRPTVQLSPRYVQPIFQLSPRYVRPTVQLSPRYVQPTVYLRPHYVRPTVLLRPSYVQPTVSTILGVPTGPALPNPFQEVRPTYYVIGTAQN